MYTAIGTSNVCAALIALVLAGVVASVEAAMNQDIERYWDRDYGNTAQRITDDKALRKVAVGGVPQGYPPVLDVQSMTWDTDRDPLDVVLRRTEALLNGLRTADGWVEPDGFAGKLSLLRTAAQSVAVSDSATRRTLFHDASALRRQLVMSNPLLSFKDVVFMGASLGLNGFFQGVGYGAINFGGNREGRTGAGPLVIRDWKSPDPRVESVLNGHSVIADGDMAGKTINGVNNYHSVFDLSFDGQEIAFAAQLGPKQRILKVRTDGTGLRDLSGNAGHHMVMPCFLPNGRIVFGAEVDKGDRCGGFGTVLHSMKSDGADRYPISWHETAEYWPSVDNDGMIVYSRWDYVDRSFFAAHNLWTCWPDGRDPRAPHGNYAYPLSLATPEWSGKALGYDIWDRPNAETFIRAIPGTSGKYVAALGTHHDPLQGVPALIDVTVRDDYRSSQVKLIYGATFPDERTVRPKLPPNRFYMLWPLSEDFYLTTDYANILLLDRYGNVEFVYKWLDADSLWNFNRDGSYSAQRGLVCGPRPFAPRTPPPELPVATWQGERAGAANHKAATISVTNVYESDFPWPAGIVENRGIKALRIIQLTPKPTGVPWSRSYMALESNALQNAAGLTRMVLGDVPVESDGSAYFEAPVGREIYFQALDEKGMAVQSMRSGTYVHPGEQLSCTGCHEDKWKATTPPSSIPLAMRRAPSKIRPDVDGSCPVNFYRLVEPTFRNTCLPCHQKEGKGIQDFSYMNLRNWVFWFNHAQAGAYGRDGLRTYAGRFGATESKMVKSLMSSHADRISDEQFHRVTLWIDAGALRFASHEDTAAQVAGEIVWPRVAGAEVDPSNPTGVERVQGVAVSQASERRALVGAACSFTGVGPNPFSRSTSIRLVVPAMLESEHESAVLQVHAGNGRLVRTIEYRHLRPGSNALVFDGVDRRGRPLPQGMYTCILRTAGLHHAFTIVRASM